MIKAVTSDFFGCSKGLLIDNAYDQYTLNLYVQYSNSNQIEYLQSQDNELGYLNHFEHIKFLSIPEEATNFEELNRLKCLKGLGIFSSSLKDIDFNIIEKLEYLDIIFNSDIDIDFSRFKSLKYLRISHFPLKEIDIKNDLEVIELNYCKKIADLNFLKNLKNVKRIKLDYLPKLENIIGLNSISKKIEIIEIIDCKKIYGLEEVLSGLPKLKSIVIITRETDSKMQLRSLCFLEKLMKLESFATDYKILDGDLSYLLNLNDAKITAFYKNYNLRDSDLPHISVAINDNGTVKRVKLDSLELGKNDKRIIWLN